VPNHRERDRVETDHLRGHGVPCFALGGEGLREGVLVDGHAPSLLVHPVEPDGVDSRSE
jgi:hypothetical protein